MSKKALVGMGIAMIILVAGVGCTRKPATDSSQTNNPTTSQTTQKQSLKDLLGMTGAQKCTFTNTINGTQSTGTVYIADKKMRGDFVTTANSQVVNSHMITRENTMYMWADTMKNGFKITLDKASTESSASTATTNKNHQTVDIDQKLDYDCDSWSTDASKFVLPTDITFTDYSEMMPESMMNVNANASGSATVDMKKMQCAACDQVPAESRGECKKALGC